MNDHTFDSRPDSGVAEGSTEGQALQPEHAFVVQLRSGPATSRRRLQGRVEHVVSGEAARFGSTAELVDFLTRLLDAPRPSRVSRRTVPRALEERAAGNLSDTAIGVARYEGEGKG
jgi:hypothetical protein